MLENLLVGIGGAVPVVALGIVITWYVLHRRDLPDRHAKVVNTLSVEEMTELVEKISEGYVRGIRSVLGLDLAGEVIDSPSDEEEGPISPVNQLEMDPFMGEDMEWLITPTPPNNASEE